MTRAQHYLYYSYYVLLNYERMNNAAYSITIDDQYNNNNNIIVVTKYQSILSF